MIMIFMFAPVGDDGGMFFLSAGNFLYIASLLQKNTQRLSTLNLFEVPFAHHKNYLFLRTLEPSFTTIVTLTTLYLLRTLEPSVPTIATLTNLYLLRMLELSVTTIFYSISN